MAKVQKGKKVSKIKVKKKTWFKLAAPKIFGNKEVGESYLASPESALGRKMKINLKDLSGNIRDQNVYISLQITKASGSLLQTSVVGYELTPAYVKRVVRKRTGRVDDHFRFKTKSGQNVIVKTLLVTLHKAQRSTKTQLKKELGKLLNEEISKNGFDNLVANMVNHKIQVGMKKKLNKIFPVKEVSIRVFKLNEKGLAKEEIVVEDKTKKEAAEEKVEEKAETKPEEVKEDGQEEEKNE